MSANDDDNHHNTNTNLEAQASRIASFEAETEAEAEAEEELEDEEELDGLSVCSCCCAASASGYLSGGEGVAGEELERHRDSTASSGGCCPRESPKRAEAESPAPAPPAAISAPELPGEAEPEAAEPEVEQEREQALLKRRYVLTELVETERDYVLDLGKIVEGYLEEIRRQLRDSGIADALTTGVVLASAELSACQLAPNATCASTSAPTSTCASASVSPAAQLADAQAQDSQDKAEPASAIAAAAAPENLLAGEANEAQPAGAAPQSVPTKWPALPEALRDGKHKIIFGNVEAIYEFHRDHFLLELERCLEEPHRLGPLFKRYERRLNMYVVYCQNKPRSEVIVSEHLDSYFEVSY